MASYKRPSTLSRWVAFFFMYLLFNRVIAEDMGVEGEEPMEEEEVEETIVPHYFFEGYAWSAGCSGSSYSLQLMNINVSCGEECYFGDNITISGTVNTEERLPSYVQVVPRICVSNVCTQSLLENAYVDLCDYVDDCDGEGDHNFTVQFTIPNDEDAYNEFLSQYATAQPTQASLSNDTMEPEEDANYENRTRTRRLLSSKYFQLKISLRPVSTFTLWKALFGYQVNRDMEKYPGDYSNSSSSRKRNWYKNRYKQKKNQKRYGDAYVYNESQLWQTKAPSQYSQYPMYNEYQYGNNRGYTQYRNRKRYYRNKAADDENTDDNNGNNNNNEEEDDDYTTTQTNWRNMFRQSPQGHISCYVTFGLADRDRALYLGAYVPQTYNSWKRIGKKYYAYVYDYTTLQYVAASVGIVSLWGLFCRQRRRTSTVGEQDGEASDNQRHDMECTTGQVATDFVPFPSYALERTRGGDPPLNYLRAAARVAVKTTNSKRSPLLDLDDSLA